METQIKIVIKDMDNLTALKKVLEELEQIKKEYNCSCTLIEVEI